MSEYTKICYNCFCERPDIEGPCPNCGYDPEWNRKKYPLALPHGYLLCDKYIVGRVLGQGGYGITYLAMDKWLGNKVAVKEYLPEVGATRDGATCHVTASSIQKEKDYIEGKESFLQEARVLAAFTEQPNIVRIHGYFEENGTAYFVMDYVIGISFQKYIVNHSGKIPWEDAYAKLHPIMCALEAVHQKGMIHRDIAADNIYVTGDGIVKLLDFGAARQQSLNQSHSLDVILKHGYAPLEQYSRRGKQGPFTDVYALAACFYAAVTGVLPPDAIERINEDELEGFAVFGVWVPDAVEQVIFKALAVMIENRYQTMTEFRMAMEDAVAPPKVEPVYVKPEPVEVKPQQPIVEESVQVKEPEQAKNPIYAEPQKNTGLTETVKKPEKVSQKKKISRILIACIPLLLVAIIWGLWENPIKPAEENMDSTKESEGLEFELAEDGQSYIVAGIGDCKDSDIVIPSTYNGKKVTKIGYFAFESCRALRSIKIPSSVIEIEGRAFAYCNNLKTIEIPSSVLKMGSEVFEGSGIETVYCEVDSEPSEWNRYWYPIDAEVIWGYGVSDNNDSTEDTNSHTHQYSKWIVAKEATCTEYGKQERKCSCGAIETEEIPMAGHTYVTDQAVAATCDKTGLTEGSHCSVCGVVKIKQEIVERTEHNYKNGKCSVCGKEKASEGLEFELSKDGESYTVISHGDCWDPYLIIPSTYNGKPVKRIEENAFWSCGFIETLEILSDEITIEEGAFGFCTSLETVIISSNKVKMEDYVFTFCENLTSVKLPKSVIKMGYGVFLNNTSLKKIYCEAESRPSGWDKGWNIIDSYTKERIDAVWGHKIKD